MPPRKAAKAPPGNPEWVKILEGQRDKIQAKDPGNMLLYMHNKAIRSLTNTVITQNYPGEMPIQFVGPKVISILNEALGRKAKVAAIVAARGQPAAAARPVNGYDSLVSGGESSSDLPSSSGETYPTARDKGKGRARENAPDFDLGLNEVSGLFGMNGSKAPPAQAAPKQPSQAALDKAAAVEEAILIGMYTQCHEHAQKLWADEEVVTMLAGAFMTHQVPVLGPRLIALLGRSLIETMTQGGKPVYSFTAAGYHTAEAAAVKRGMPAVKAVRIDFQKPAPAQSTRPSDASDMTAAMAGARAALQRQQQAQVQANAQSAAVARPKGIVQVDRNARPVGDYEAIIPKKRANPLHEDDSYKGLTQYVRPAAEAAAAPAVALPAYKPVNKRFTAATVASVFHDKPAACVSSASGDLPFSFTYLDADDMRVSSREDADLKPDPADGTMMYRVEYRSRQARHPLARIAQDKEPLNRQPPDIDGATESGWMSHKKAPAKCPGLASSRNNNNKARMTTDTPAPLQPRKTGSAAGAVQSLMAGSGQSKKNDMRAMYKLPTAHGVAASTVFASKAPSKSTAAQEVSTPPPAQPKPKTVQAARAAVPSRTVPVASGSGTSASAASASNRVEPAKSSADLLSGKNTNAPLPRPFGAPESHASVKSFAIDLDVPREFPQFQPIAMKRGTYDICILIDHREFRETDQLHQMLNRRGIRNEKVNLDMGDYLWVARRQQPKGDVYDEIVLAICERKRKDDFTQSIKDNRYKDQKRRIKTAGIRRCFYLVEHCDLRENDHEETFLKAIQTSTNQTTLVDEFSLHTAGSEQETMLQLMRIAKALQDELNTNTLYVIPQERVKQGEIAHLQRHLEATQPERIYYTCRASFNVASARNVTLHSTWAKMIGCVMGASEEQCEDVLGVFATPAAYFAAMEARLEAHQAHLEAEYDASQDTQTARPAKKSKKELEESDPRQYVKMLTARPNQPRPMNNPTSGRLWELATAHEYKMKAADEDD